jgi:hypothetical protein
MCHVDSIHVTWRLSLSHVKTPNVPRTQHSAAVCARCQRGKVGRMSDAVIRNVRNPSGVVSGGDASGEDGLVNIHWLGQNLVPPAAACTDDPAQQTNKHTHTHTNTQTNTHKQTQTNNLHQLASVSARFHLKNNRPAAALHRRNSTWDWADRMQEPILGVGGSVTRTRTESGWIGYKNPYCRLISCKNPHICVAQQFSAGLHSACCPPVTDPNRIITCHTTARYASRKTA